MDFLEFWSALQRLPLAIAVTVCALAVLTAAAFVLVPLVFIFRTEPAAIVRSFAADRLLDTEQSRWRRSLLTVAACLTAVNTAIGRLSAWLALYIVLMQFVIVVLRYIFAYGSIQMQESIWYMHGMLFMLCAGYVLAKDAHVRLDVFYRDADKRTKARINLAGSILLLLPFSVATFVYAWPQVLNSWSVREGSLETLGLPYLYLLKSVILVFSALLAIEGVAAAIRSVLDLTANPNKAE